jgi:hypothetical protein
MEKVFQFGDKESFYSESSREFAKIVMASSIVLQRQLMGAYGLQIELSDTGYRIGHDGRRIGLGAFTSTSGTVHFAIAPKVDTIRLESLFQALGGHVAVSQYVTYDTLASEGPAEFREDEFRPAFLVQLLEDILQQSLHFLSVSVPKKKEVFVANGTKGRPQLAVSVQQIMQGRRFGFYCELPDDQGLRDYAVVLIATARSISELLEAWYELVPTDKKEYLPRLGFLISRFSGMRQVLFSRALLYKVCRPPFPYGLREILYRCLRYWEWNGEFGLAKESQELHGYWGLTVQLDQIFQAFVGRALQQAIGVDFDDLGSPSYLYHIRGLPAPKTAPIRLDRCFFNAKTGTLVIVDAKYSTRIADEANVYQMVSYMSYEYRINPKKIVGILVYPGDQWHVGKIDGFIPRLYWVNLPVSPSGYRDEMSQWLGEVLN